MNTWIRADLQNVGYALPMKEILQRFEVLKGGQTRLPKNTPKPSPTRRLQATPIPTPIQRGCRHCRRQKNMYVNTIDDIITEFGSTWTSLGLALDDLVVDLQDGDGDKSTIARRWLDRHSDMLNNFSNNTDRFRRIKPIPPSMRSLHDDFVTLAHIADDFVDQLITGLTEFDSGGVGHALELMQDLRQLLEVIGRKATELCI